MTDKIYKLIESQTASLGFIKDTLMKLEKAFGNYNPSKFVGQINGKFRGELYLSSSEKNLTSTIPKYFKIMKGWEVADKGKLKATKHKITFINDEHKVIGGIDLFVDRSKGTDVYQVTVSLRPATSSDIKEFIIKRINEKLDRGAFMRLEASLDNLFRSLGVDVEFTKHFMDRVNDARNGKDITYFELKGVFDRFLKKYGSQLHNVKHDMEAVIKDLKTLINVPFSLEWDEKQKMYVMVLKTIMRKQNFTTGAQKVLKLETK